MSVRVLYVEDEVILAKIVSEDLANRGFEVRVIHDGSHVMAAMEDFSPDICVLDIMLPSIDGYTLATHILERSPSLPILFLSAKSQTEDVVRGFKVGASDYLRKPFGMDELIVRMQSLLQRRSVADIFDVDSHAIGTLRHDLKSLRLYQDETYHDLSHRTHELLKYLFLHRHQTISRRDLLLALWGDDSHFHSRNLDVYVKKVRDLLSVDPRIQLITLKGVGYRFVVP